MIEERGLSRALLRGQDSPRTAYGTGDQHGKDKKTPETNPENDAGV